MVKNRNYNIDLFKGIAAIGIIFIHTVFWSGESYAPDWIRSLSLLIDVPLFIFISGISFSFHESIIKMLKGFLKLWKIFILFLILYYSLTFFIDYDNFTLSNIVKSIFFSFPGNSRLYVVGGSFWLVYMYFTVSLIASAIITVYNRHFKSLDNFKYILLFSFFIYGMKLYYPSFFFLDIQTLFYLFIYLLGYYFSKIKIDGKTFVILEFLTLTILYFLTRHNDYGFNMMQTAKFAYHINYMVYSMIAILVVTYFKDVLKIKKKNILTFIGENALSFFFCLGLGSTFIYEFLQPLNSYSIGSRVAILTLINFVTTFVSVLVLKGGVLLLDKFIDFFKKKKVMPKLLCFKLKK